MSLFYTCDVHCDRCGEWAHGVTAHTSKGLATPTLRIAKAHGWSRYVRSVFTDLCPKCLEESRKEPA